MMLIDGAFRCDLIVLHGKHLMGKADLSLLSIVKLTVSRVIGIYDSAQLLARRQLASRLYFVTECRGEGLSPLLPAALCRCPRQALANMGALRLLHRFGAVKRQCQPIHERDQLGLT